MILSGFYFFFDDIDLFGELIFEMLDMLFTLCSQLMLLDEMIFSATFRTEPHVNAMLFALVAQVSLLGVRYRKAYLTYSI